MVDVSMLDARGGPMCVRHPRPVVTEIAWNFANKTQTMAATNGARRWLAVRGRFAREACAFRIPMVAAIPEAMLAKPDLVAFVAKIQSAVTAGKAAGHRLSLSSCVAHAILRLIARKIALAFLSNAAVQAPTRFVRVFAPSHLPASLSCLAACLFRSSTVYSFSFFQWRMGQLPISRNDPSNSYPTEGDIVSRENRVPGRDGGRRVSTEQQVLEPQFVSAIALEINCRADQVLSAAALLAEGATVPFIARYRKEATGGLDDEQLEILDKKRTYFLELAARRDTILESIADQEKLTPELEAKIRACVLRQELEDLYLPYKPKRRTRGQIARERGLEPLADALLEAADAGTDPATLAEAFVDPEKEVADTDAALAGAMDVLAERLSDSADNRAYLRNLMQDEGQFVVRVVTGKEDEGAVYRDYFDHSEPMATIPSHRLLAILRGEREGFLISDLSIEDEVAVDRLAAMWQVSLSTSAGALVFAATADGYKRLLRPSITNEMRTAVRERAESEAIGVFRANLEDLLMQSPFGRHVVMAVDPGQRTGSKIAVIDEISKVAATATIYPLPPQSDEAGSARTIVSLAKAHNVRAIAIGNGTGSRDVERFVRQTTKEAGLDDIIVAIVPETGASVYSASKVAREEFPDLDVSIRGAISIARRLQDPLAEFVKIEPRSLGVGQYQHDVNQKALEKELELAVEGVVNRVGVELNTASLPLLRRVSGVSARIAKSMIEYRDQNGPYAARKDLLKVRGFGPKTFEQAAGFLRIHGAANPLDTTAVHPERYDLITKMASDLGTEASSFVGNPELIKQTNFSQFIDEDNGIGQFTLDDIRKELLQPGRDPRPEYKAPTYREDVVSINDLNEGMILEGRVSNVANFGAFVDLGIKRDGLIHISELSDQWIDDPRKVVQVGQIVKVKVVEVDKQRGRVGLSRKALLEGGAGAYGQGQGRSQSPSSGSSTNRSSQHASQASARPRQQPSRGTQKHQKSNRSSKQEGPVTIGDLMKKFGK